MRVLRGLIVLVMASVFLVSCHEPEPEPKPTPTPVDGGSYRGMYILNQGMMSSNNSSISYFDFATGKVTLDMFKDVNRRGLGDTGNDLLVYGSKMYAVVNVSNLVEVINVADCKSIKSISVPGRQPRRAVSHEGKVYVSCFDGSVLKIDTATLEIEATAQAGANPEGICVANNKLYVANSGGLNFPNYGHSVSVFDLASFTKLTDIEVGLNPCGLQSDYQGDVYVNLIGNYKDIKPCMQRIDSKIDTVVNTFNVPVTNFFIHDQHAYLYSFDYSTLKSTFHVLNVGTEQIINNNFIADGTFIETPYGIAVNPENGDVFIGDAFMSLYDGNVYCFNNAGRCQYTFEVGRNPGVMVFVK